jgi:ankyrin repeat protein
VSALENGRANPNARENLGMSLILMVAVSGSDALVRILLSRSGTNLTVENANKTTYLLSKFDNIGPELLDCDQRMPLSWAAKRERVKIVEQLLSFGQFDPDSQG